MSNIAVFSDNAKQLDNNFRRFERFFINGGCKEKEWAAYLCDIAVDGQGTTCLLEITRQRF